MYVFDKILRKNITFQLFKRTKQILCNNLTLFSFKNKILSPTYLFIVIREKSYLAITICKFDSGNCICEYIPVKFRSPCRNKLENTGVYLSSSLKDGSLKCYYRCRKFTIFTYSRL